MKFRIISVSKFGFLNGLLSCYILFIIFRLFFRLGLATCGYPGPGVINEIADVGNPGCFRVGELFDFLG